MIDDRSGYNGDIYADSLSLTGIQYDQLWFERSDNNLVIRVIGTEDQVVVQDWYLSQSNQIETISTSDGMQLLNTDLDQLVSAMAGMTAPLPGELTLPADVQEALQPVLTAAWQPA